MSVRTASGLFIDSSIEWSQEFYQRLFCGVLSFQEIGNRLVRVIEHAQAFRRYDRVESAAKILSNLPLKNYQAAGQYYLGLREYRKNGDLEKSRRIFEHVANAGPTKYSALALLSLSALAALKQDYETELYYALESLKVSPTLTTTVGALKGIAVLKAKVGDHQAALKAIENIYPLARQSEPVVYHDYLNSLAVELTVAGRKQEARNICQVVQASPFACAYPEWKETANDLKQASRSIVTINSPQPIPHNVLLMPVTELGECTARHTEPARVLDLQKWKKKTDEGKKSDGGKPTKELTGQQMLMQIMGGYISNNTTDMQRYKIYEYALKVASQSAEPDNPDNGGGGG